MAETIEQATCPSWNSIEKTCNEAEDYKRLEAKIEQQQKMIRELKKFIKHSRHLKGCKTNFIDSSIDRTCNTFYKECDCGYQEAIAKAEEFLK